MRAELRRLLRWERPPARFQRVAIMILAITVALYVAALVVGVMRYGEAGKGLKEGRIGTYASSALLAGAGVLAAVAARRSGGRGWQRRWRLTALLFAYLALDDLLMIHERMDFAIHRGLGWDPEHPLTDHLDDVIVASYWLAYLALWWPERERLVRLTWFARPLLAGFACYALMVVVDLGRAVYAVEDGIKMLSESLILIAFAGALLTPAEHDVGR